MDAARLAAREPRSCPRCGEPLEDGYCDACGYDDDDNDDFDRDELGDDPEED